MDGKIEEHDGVLYARDGLPIDREAAHARAFLAISAAGQNSDDMETRISDLIVDFGHYADLEGLDFNSIWDRALMHLQNER